jgi:hypothetical protein
MAFSISTQFQDALDAYERYGVVFFTFSFGTGTYGLHSGPGEIPYNGLTYRGGASVLNIGNIELQDDGSVAEFTISLSTSPEKGLTSDILSTFYDEDWHMRPVTVQLAMVDPDTYQPHGIVTILEGIIYEAPLKKGLKSAKIEGRIVSKTIRMSESGGKYRNTATQTLLDPTDTALVGIGNLGGFTEKDLKWGQQ